MIRRWTDASKQLSNRHPVAIVPALLRGLMLWCANPGRTCDDVKHQRSTQLGTCKYRGWTNCTPAYTAENCIATRGDLNSASGVWGIDAYGHRNHVATDSKISQFSTYDATKVGADVVSGPVGAADNSATPDFVWSGSTFSALPHHGMPDRMVFPWVRFDF